jgi:hypothetical protein
MDAIILSTLQILPFYRSVGVLRSRVHLAVSEENEAHLAWLEGALNYAFVERKPELWDYLEAVMDEVLFEVENGPLRSAKSETLLPFPTLLMPRCSSAPGPLSS